MFRSKRDSADIISPLAPPAETSRTRDLHNSNSGHGNGTALNRGMQSRGGPEISGSSTQGGPMYSAGGNMNRQTSIDTTASSSKGEKRRSGFFGLSKKKEEKKEPPFRVRDSFALDHSNPPVLPRQSNPPVPSKLQQSNPEFQPYEMRQFPPPHNGTTPPPPPPVPLSNQRSNSFPRPAPNDHNPTNGGSYPTSQSMSFATRQGGQSGEGDTFHRTQDASVRKQSPHQQMGQGRPSGIQDNLRSASMPVRPGIAPESDSYGSSQGAEAVPAYPADSETQFNDVKSEKIGSGGPTPAVNKSNPSGDGAPNWLDQFSPIVELIAAQAAKTYVASPPELEMILARTSAGGQPKQGQPGSEGNDWDGVWLQLSGISLSMWSMKETRVAAAKGDKVPPTYFNVTDSSLELLSPLPPPPHRPDSHPHRYVFSLNTAGSNRLLFSCPTERALAHWSSGLRLAAWERARLEEIYTGHLIRSGGKEPRTPLLKGRMEGWVRVRVMGGTEWRRLWLVLSKPGNDDSPGTTPKEDDKKSRRRSFFGIGGGEKQHHDAVIQEPNTGISMASFYAEPRTVKNKTQVALLTISDITQSYAVFPERLEVIMQSNLMKVVGRIGGEIVTIEGRLRDSGWALIMPEATSEPTHSSPPITPLVNMMRWVTGFHDVFGLYGRPQKYNWDVKDPKSLWFAYPQGEDRGRLFLDVEDALSGELRGQNLARIRQVYIALTNQKLLQSFQIKSPADAPTEEEDVERPEGNYRLPPLSFGEPSPQLSENTGPRSLTPITERTDIASRENSTRTNNSSLQYGDRKASGASSKHGSGASNRHTSNTTEGDRLAPIADSSETFSHLTEEPEPVSKGETTPHASTSPERAGPASRADTNPTIWSQDTGVTPDGSQQISPISAEPLSSTALHALPLANPSRSSNISDKTVSDTTHIAKDKSKHPLPAPISPPSNDVPAEVLAPTPRRVSSGSFDRNSSSGLRDGALHEEPAAKFLMHMVEEPAPITPADRTLPAINTAMDGLKLGDNLGRKPSGARAPPPRKSAGSRGLDAIDDETQHELHDRMMSKSTQADLGDDAKMFVNYGDEAQDPVAAPVEKATESQTAPKGEPMPEMTSSFTLSKAAKERRAKAEEQAEARRLAMRQPGAGRRAAGQSKPDWSDSDEEEQDVESDDGGHLYLSKAPVRQVSPAAVQRSTSRALPPVPSAQNSMGHEEFRHQLPQLPQDRSRSRSPGHMPIQSRTLPTSQTQAQIQPTIRQLPQPNRQSVWNANFDQEHGLDTQRSSKFVELDEPSRMTTAFAPHGLLQAGIQDKEERSAKKQEELARETGSSLLNVPSKPPPPQTGLLGAVAAHEKERQGAGGIGAALTDRDRERRLAEERQRKIDELQREQMEHYAQFGQGGGDAYGQQNPYNRMSMMSPPMPPMQPYGSWGGQLNPWQQQQAMLAAQMAYHQSLAMMSHPGSQAGDHDRPVSPSGSYRGLPAQAGSPPPGSYNPYYPPPMSMPPMPYGYSPMMPWQSPLPGSPSYGSGLAPPPAPGFGRAQSGYGYDWSGQGQGYSMQNGSHGSPAASEQRSRVTSMVSDSGRGDSGERPKQPAS